MIYIDITTEVLPVRLPRTSAAPFEGAKLYLKSTVDRVTYEVPVTGIQDDGDYYAIVADFSAIKTSGEYEYRLAAGGANLALGLAVIGAIPAEVPEQYEQKAEFEQYEQ